MKIGIILGTFDPIHMSHTLLASTILNLKLVDKVYFVPTVQNPWKINHPIASCLFHLYSKENSDVASTAD